jgi:hypothetical protein
MAIVLGLTVVIDGAILFFCICGAFGYLSERAQALILEDTIQIINAVFSFLCLVELPLKVRAAFWWTRVGSPENAGNAAVQQCAEGLRTHHEWCFHRWRTFGFLMYTKIFQVFCQMAVEYYCLAYLGNDNFQDRPATQFTICICLALPLGCLGGAYTLPLYRHSR